MATILDQPPPELRFRRRLGPRTALAELWRYREVVRSLLERELRVRYAQAFLGIGWALVTPITLMVVFTLFFNRVAKVDTQGAPYPLFSYLGLLPWTYFSSAVASAGTSLTSNVSLLNKVYCPREVFPLAVVGSATVDSLFATVALGALFVLFGEVPAATSYWLPVLLLILVLFNIAISLAVAGITVLFRDLRHALSILLQLGLFATPVVYSIDTIPREYRGLYVTLNPIAAVIEGLRDSMLYGNAPHLPHVGLALASASLLLAGTYFLFKRMEPRFADVA